MRSSSILAVASVRMLFLSSDLQTKRNDICQKNIQTMLISMGGVVNMMPETFTSQDMSWYPVSAGMTWKLR